MRVGGDSLPSDGSADPLGRAMTSWVIDLDDVLDREGPELPETVSGGDGLVLFVEELLRCVEHMEGSVTRGWTVGADGVNVGEDGFVGATSEGSVEDIHYHVGVGHGLRVGNLLSKGKNFLVLFFPPIINRVKAGDLDANLGQLLPSNVLGE